MSSPPQLRSRLRAGRRLRYSWVALYLLLLIASHAVQRVRSDADSPDPRSRFVELPEMTGAGPLTPARAMRVAYLEWPASGAPDTAGVPVLLLHGSPGSASNFDELGPLLAARGRRVIAVDLPGFGDSTRDVRDYSILAHARGVLALMDALGLPRAHVLGWSQGGGVAIHMADLAPQRVASLALLGSIGAQETEGSGSYAFEHAKYAVGYAALVVAPKLVPHFGLLGDQRAARSFIRNFWDTDQRPLASIMARLRVPTLILHGRSDFLVPAWAAEEHHRLIPSSALVMLDATHFIPFLDDECRAAGEHLALFFARHDDPAALARRQVADLAPADRPIFGGVGRWVARQLDLLPWWVLIALVAVAFVVHAPLTVIAVGLLVGELRLDFGVGYAGILLGGVVHAAGHVALGRFLGERARRLPVLGRRLPAVSRIDWDRRLQRPWRTAMLARFIPEMTAAGLLACGMARRCTRTYLAATFVALCLWSALILVCIPMVGPVALDLFAPFLGPLALVPATLLLLVVLRALTFVCTWTGRQRIKATLARIVRREYWPAWLFYLPLLPRLLRLSVRHRGALVFTCCNPGIEAGGGVIGESKHKILAALGGAGARVLPAVLVERGPSPERRAAAALEALRRRPELGGLPVILKPDSGFRGYSLRLARSERDVREYFESMPRDVIVQKYHPGPHECGVFWARRPERDGQDSLPGAAGGGRVGFIFSITRKTFPFVTGDGGRTLEELILADARFRCQAPVFFERFRHDRSRVLGPGEAVRLAVAGNHCQGTRFADGSDLITPALEDAIDAIARDFRSPAGAALDFGRFDLRYESDEALRRGEGFGIVELNGTLAESTNLYDPDRSLRWAYSVLFRQWDLAYELGAQRRREGAEPLTWRELVRSWRAHYRERPGSAVSD